MMKLGYFSLAKEGLLKLLDIKQKIYGEEDLEYARTLENLSVSVKKLGDYERAKIGY